MFEVKISKQDNLIVVKWQLSKIEIPISDIMNVTYDDSYAGKSKRAMRIGYPYGTTDRILIQTARTDYLIYTSIGSTMEKVLSLINKEK